MSWPQKKRFIPRLVEPHNIKLVSGRTQFIPLERYQKPEKWLPFCYQAGLHLLAGYGLFRIAEKLARLL